MLKMYNYSFKNDLSNTNRSKGLYGESHSERVIGKRPSGKGSYIQIKTSIALNKKERE